MSFETFGETVIDIREPLVATHEQLTPEEFEDALALIADDQKMTDGQKQEFFDGIAQKNPEAYATYRNQLPNVN